MYLLCDTVNKRYRYRCVWWCVSSVCFFIVKAFLSLGSPFHPWFPSKIFTPSSQTRPAKFPCSPLDAWRTRIHAWVWKCPAPVRPGWCWRGGFRGAVYLVDYLSLSSRDGSGWGGWHLELDGYTVKLHDFLMMYCFYPLFSYFFSRMKFLQFFPHHDLLLVMLTEHDFFPLLQRHGIHWSISKRQHVTMTRWPVLESTLTKPSWKAMGSEIRSVFMIIDMYFVFIRTEQKQIAFFIQYI